MGRSAACGVRCSGCRAGIARRMSRQDCGDEERRSLDDEGDPGDQLGR